MDKANKIPKPLANLADPEALIIDLIGKSRRQNPTDTNLMPRRTQNRPRRSVKKLKITGDKWNGNRPGWTSKNVQAPNSVSDPILGNARNTFGPGPNTKPVNVVRKTVNKVRL